jgi:cobalt/nickel transport protein
MEMLSRLFTAFLFMFMAVIAAPAYAHFQMIVPSTEIVSTKDSKEISLKLLFAHPMEGPAMDMAKPVAFGVLAGGEKRNLLETIEPTEYRGHSAFKTTYEIKRPGDHIFYVEPAPYWEPAEGVMIVHYTKVIVNAMGLEEGWDSEVGLKTEIVPLARPYGLWAGNEFRGIVKKDGQAVPFAKVEVEYYNEDGAIKAPADPFVTQVIKADNNGVFSYAMPRAGWWGFAALSEGNTKIKSPEGEEVPVESGAVIWVRTRPME